MLVWGLWGVVVALEGMAIASESEKVGAIGKGLSILINVWGLGLVDIVIASIIIAIGVYRQGRRQLKALRP